LKFSKYEYFPRAVIGQRIGVKKKDNCMPLIINCATSAKRAHTVETIKDNIVILKSKIINPGIANK
jgi:hypothetical protein